LSEKGGERGRKIVVSSFIDPVVLQTSKEHANIRTIFGGNLTPSLVPFCNFPCSSYRSRDEREGAAVLGTRMGED
jgi:hypothetical protein